MKPFGVPVERLNGGKPILAPTEFWWESGVTFNTASIYLERSYVNEPIIKKLLSLDDLDDPRLDDGVVVLHYRARPKTDPGFKWTRSFIGLAVFTPDLELLTRSTEPVISPGTQPTDFDYFGVEDPRITLIEDTFYMVYCGLGPHPTNDFSIQLCMASSKDLIHWDKLGPIIGDINKTGNKDGVLFPGKIDNQFFMLHRPMIGKLSDFSMHIAMSTAIQGEWKNCGMVMHSFENPLCRDSWLGAGSVPFPMGDKRYMVIYHTGNYLHTQNREYDLDAAIFNFQKFTPGHPEGLVEHRLEPLMVPETPLEIEAPFPDSVGNVLFTCGTYRYKRYIYLMYGGGDTFILAARIDAESLLKSVEKCDLTNPFIPKEMAGAL